MEEHRRGYEPILNDLLTAEKGYPHTGHKSRGVRQYVRRWSGSYFQYFVESPLGKIFSCHVWYERRESVPAVTKSTYKTICRRSSPRSLLRERRRTSRKSPLPRTFASTSGASWNTMRQSMNLSLRTASRSLHLTSIPSFKIRVCWTKGCTQWDGIPGHGESVAGRAAMIDEQAFYNPMDGPFPISRRSFNERLLETLPVPSSERQQLLELARSKGRPFRVGWSPGGS